MSRWTVYWEVDVFSAPDEEAAVTLARQYIAREDVDPSEVVEED